MDTLEKLGKKCRERAASTAIMEHLRQDSNKSHNLMRNRLLEDLLDKRLDAPSPERLCNEYDFNVQNGMLQIFILKTDYAPEKLRGTAMSAIRQKAEELFDTTIFPLCLTGVFHFYLSAGYGALNYEPQKSDQIRRALRQFLNQLESHRFIFGSVEFSLAVGKAVDSAEKLPLSMSEAQNAIAERIVEGTGRLLEAVPPTSQVDLHKLLEKYSRAMDHTVDMLSVEDADKTLDELKSDVERIPDIRGYEILDLILSAGKIFAIRLNTKEKSELMREYEERCDLFGSADRLFDCLRDFQRRQISAAYEQRENEVIRPIRIAKQYIHQHFNEPITREDVCAATGFSVSYFSTMFKKETGEGFSKYLTRVRIERAKALLQDTNCSVVDVCGQVGYSDLKHFTNTFKKMTSLNPGQYRKLYG